MMAARTQTVVSTAPSAVNGALGQRSQGRVTGADREPAPYGEPAVQYAT